MKARRSSFNYTAWSIAPFVAVAAVLALLWGTSGVLAAGLFGLPWFAWRYDNETGAFLVLAVLFIIVFGVLALLLMLMSIFHA